MIRPNSRAVVIGLVALVMIGLVALNVRSNARPALDDPANTTQVALGQQVYAANCASCHGKNLEGQPNWQERLPDGTMPAPPHDAGGHTWHHNDESLFTTIKFGGQATAPPGYISAMPAFSERLSDNEIRAVLAYIKSTWPPEVLAAQQRQGHQ